MCSSEAEKLTVRSLHISILLMFLFRCEGTLEMAQTWKENSLRMIRKLTSITNNSIWRMAVPFDSRQGEGHFSLFFSHLRIFARQVSSSRVFQNHTNSSLSTCPATLIHYPVDAYCFIPVVKRPKREADHPLPTSADGKNGWIYTSTSVPLHNVILTSPVTSPLMSTHSVQQLDVRCFPWSGTPCLITL
jgi:hypothetical protein